MTRIFGDQMRANMAPVPRGTARVLIGNPSPRVGIRSTLIVNLLIAVAVAATPSASLAADPSVEGRAPIVIAQNADAPRPAQSRNRNTLRAHMSGKLRGWQQHVVMEIQLASLGIDPKKKLKSVRGLQAEISRVIKGTRFGDEALNLRAATDKGVLDAVARVEGEWTKFNNVLNPMLDSGELSADGVGALVELSLPLLASSEQLADRAEVAEGNRRRTYTVLVSTINHATKHSMVSHRIMTEYLLIARGYKVDLTKIKLARSIKEFDDGLEALVNGSAKDRVLAAPSDNIKDQYMVVRRIWRELRPIFLTAAGPGSAGSGALQTVAQGMSLSRELDRALDLYHQL